VYYFWPPRFAIGSCDKPCDQPPLYDRKLRDSSVVVANSKINISQWRTRVKLYHLPVYPLVWPTQSTGRVVPSILCPCPRVNCWTKAKHHIYTPTYACVYMFQNKTRAVKNDSGTLNLLSFLLVQVKFTNSNYGNLEKSVKTHLLFLYERLTSACKFLRVTPTWSPYIIYNHRHEKFIKRFLKNAQVILRLFENPAQKKLKRFARNPQNIIQSMILSQIPYI